MRGNYGKYKNYSLATSKPVSSHAFYQEKVWTLQERIYNSLKKITELLESLYMKLADNFSGNIKVVIERNLETLIKDLDLMQKGFRKDPSSFNTNKLKINQSHITEMRNVCDSLQTVNSYENEFKKLGKIKHALKELEHLIKPTSLEIRLEKARVKSKPKTKLPAKSKKTLPAKSKPKTKSSTASKVKLPAKSKKALPAKPKPKTKSSAASKATLPAKRKKALTAKPKSKTKSSAAHKKKKPH